MTRDTTRPRRWTKVALAALAAAVVLAGGGYLYWWSAGYPILFLGEKYTYRPEDRGDLCPRREPNLRDEVSRLPGVPHLVTLEGHVLPNYRVRTYTYSTNSEMFRGSRELKRPKKPGVYRVGVFGTGVTFGNGVDGRWVWPLLLEQRLNADGKGRFEVYNLAIPGSTTDRGVDLLDQMAPQMNFDLVFFCYGVNDGLPMFERPVHLYTETLSQLLRVRARHGLNLVYVIEPRSSFYPWPYGRYEKAFRKLFDTDGNNPIVDLPKMLDELERQNGLCLVKEGGVQKVVAYKDGKPRELFLVRYDRARALEVAQKQVFVHKLYDKKGKLKLHKEKHFNPEKGLQSVAPEVYEFIDTHKVNIHHFIDGVHLSEQGHVQVARILYEYMVGQRIAGLGKGGA